MPKTLLLEAGFMALPTELFGSRLPDFKEVVSQVLQQEKFEFSRIKVWISSHRIGVVIEGLADVQTSCVKDVRGPKASAAYDLNNLPTPAATGFAAAQGLEMKDLAIREVDGERFLFARKMTQGLPLEKCLNRVCTGVFQAFPFSCQPWSEKSVFPQPLISLCAIIDDRLIDFDIDGVKARSQVIVFNGLRKSFMPIEHAANYPFLMKQLGLMNEITEKRKNYDARIRSILPEGHLIRDPGGKVAEASLFFENSHPLLVRYEKKFLEMPEVILNKVISGYFGYLVCEDALGKVLPAAVALTQSLAPINDEVEVRSGVLNHQLEKIWQVWNRDVHSLPGRIEKIAEQITDQGQLKNELFCDCSLAGISEGLCDLLEFAEEKKLVAAVVTLIEEGEKTEIGRLLQGTGFSVIFNRLRGVDAFKPYLDCLKEVCQFFEDRIPAPEMNAAKIVSLAVLMQGHVNHVRCFDCSPERVLNFIFRAGLRFDLFAAFNVVFHGFRFERRLWIETALRILGREAQLPVSLESLYGAGEFDPASFHDAFREWKTRPVEDFEVCSSMLSRIRSKLSGIDRRVDSEPENELEKDISAKLDKLEKVQGVNYPGIFQFCTEEKVNIEACLMNLPAVLDDNSAELQPRICLLQRLCRLLSRLPFIKKEKKTEKS